MIQTFLPYPDFAASAAVLDDRRLGKQRVEALQIVRALTREGYGWQHHPAVRMWRDHPEACAAYGLAVCREWARRGWADTVAASIEAEVPAPRGQDELAAAGLLPSWLGDDRVHRSHRVKLLGKDCGHYGAAFDDPVDPDAAYVWPV